MDEFSREQDCLFGVVLLSATGSDNSSFLQRPAESMQCDYCDYTSPKRYLLSRHMKSHSEDRPHKCSICNHSFKTLISLTNHVNTHSGQYLSCFLRPSCFTWKASLNQRFVSGWFMVCHTELVPS